MRGRRHCPDSPTGVHRAFYSARLSPEATSVPCRDCGLVVIKGRDGAWYEPIIPTWYLVALFVVVVGGFIGECVFTSWASR